MLLGAFLACTRLILHDCSCTLLMPGISKAKKNQKNTEFHELRKSCMPDCRCKLPTLSNVLRLCILYKRFFCVDTLTLDFRRNLKNVKFPHVTIGLKQSNGSENRRYTLPLTRYMYESMLKPSGDSH